MKKQELFKVLDFRNYWNKDVEHINPRDNYLKKLDLFLKAWENIVISWIRRSGKSSILKLQIKKLLQSWVKKENILFVNFEEPYFFWSLNLDLLDQIWKTYLYYLEPNQD